ncbi:MAG: glycosyltransferase family 9 protein [Gammaproteobacteria bacterium]
MTGHNQQPRLLVYVGGDRLGDALFKLPAITTLRSLFPGYRITWIAGLNESIFCGALSPLVSGAIDEIIDNVELGASWWELFGPAPLHGRHYHTIIDTQTIIRKTLCLRRISHDVFVSAAASFMFSDRVPDERDNVFISVQERLLQLFNLASGKQTKPDQTLPLPPPYRTMARELLPAGPVYVGLAPGAGDRRRCWPLSGYIEIARQQQKMGRIPVFFLGPKEEDMQSRIVSELTDVLLPEQEAIRDVHGQHGPLLSLALAERIHVGVANDSGPGHILAAAGRPLVSLFGPSNPDKFFGASERRVLIRSQDFGGNAMQDIPVRAVQDAIERLVYRFHSGH